MSKFLEAHFGYVTLASSYLFEINKFCYGSSYDFHCLLYLVYTSDVNILSP